MCTGLTPEQYAAFRDGYDRETERIRAEQMTAHERAQKAWGQKSAAEENEKVKQQVQLPPKPPVITRARVHNALWIVFWVAIAIYAFRVVARLI